MPEGQAAGAAAPLRVLVVDDDSIDRELVRRALRRPGVAAAVEEAATAAEVAQKLALPAFDCVFLDYNIPGGDGLQLLASIRLASPGTPVVMLTGHGDEQVAVQLMKAGAVDYLPKEGITAERIAAALRYAVDLSRAEEMARRAEHDLRESVLRARFLAEASAVLSNTLMLKQALDQVAQLAVPMLGDCCIIHLSGRDDAPEAVVVAAANSAGEWYRRVLETQLQDSTSPAPDAAGAVLTVPLEARRRAIGSITFARADNNGFSEADAELGADLARRIAAAVDNVRLFEAAQQARAQAESARAEAEEANRAKSEFLARMSHDLRTPLNAIGGYAELVEIGVHGPVTDEQREALRRVQRAKEHLLTLINDILSFARLEAGQVTVNPEPVDIPAFVASLRPLIEPQIVAAGLSYEQRDGESDAWATADSERLVQVLLNLLTNAAKFTAAGGLVSVGWRTRSQWIDITVSDTGHGIPAERLPGIFEPFVQGGSSAAEQREGVGLGLAISRELLRMMDATIAVQSQLGVGSTFTVSLPRA